MLRKNFSGRKLRRKESAERRQKAAADRTPQEQLKRLDNGDFVATKERKKFSKK